jgi:hypothetical protein
MEVSNMVRKHLFLAIFALLVLLIPVSAQSETESITLLYNYSDDVFIDTLVDQTTVLNNVVIFIRFSDEVNYQSPYTFEEYDSLYNSLETVSLRDYYLEVSYGRLDITSHFAQNNSEIVFFIPTYILEVITNPMTQKLILMAQKRACALQESMHF